MADNQAVWGIDIGQAGLKAIRLRYAEAAGQAIAVAFDYVPHPKILSQPDAIPEELIPQALETFLSRNDTKGDLVAISLPSQNALARFIQLPPVEASKVAEIVKYEARQQIPFKLDEVIWDFQTLGSGIEESGYMLGAEVGLFAMKREQVMSSLQPFLDAKVEVELIQVAPLALHNFLCYDQMGVRLDEDFTAPEEYTLVLDMGADNTTLLVSNGEKIWIRNVPVGGNHFTRALTKEMKLTFAKAEHLKCNATKSPDPRAVFQALRPVFNDYVSEIQRSIGYFGSVNREANITKILGVGNGFKLAGLMKFLQQNLQYEVVRLESFKGLAGDSVLGAPLFQENLLSFVVPYGVALQGLKVTHIHTSLLPREIATARKIRRKKPWAVGAAASVLLGLATSTAGYSNVASSVSTDRFGEVEKAVEGFNGNVKSMEANYTQAEARHESLLEEGSELVHTLKKRNYWLEVYRAINECLPRDTGAQLDETEMTKKQRITLVSITSKRYPDLGAWFNTLSQSEKSYFLPQDKEAAPEGDGYVFTLEGHHYHDDPSDPNGGGASYVRYTLLQNLGKMVLAQPESPFPVPVRKLGITHATLKASSRPELVPFYPNGKPTQNQMGLAGFGTQGDVSGFGGGLPGGMPGGLPGGLPGGVPGGIPGGIPGGRPMVPGNPGTPGAPGEKDPNAPIEIRRTTFTLQFVWKPTPVSERVDELAPVASAADAAGVGADAAPGANAIPAGTATPPQ